VFKGLKVYFHPYLTRQLPPVSNT